MTTFYKIFFGIEIIVFGVLGGLFTRFLKENSQISVNNSQNEAAIIKTTVSVVNPADLKNEQKPNASTSTKPKINFCDEKLFSGLEEKDKNLCFREPKLTDKKGIEVDLTNSKALLYENGKFTQILPLLYQAPEEKWYQSPTGYYRIGVKKENHISSIFPVAMPFAIQYYEDFFLHGVPYYPEDKTRVSSNFTGGCLRFKDNIAKEIYDFIKTGDQITVYKTFDDLTMKTGFHSPVDLENYWIRQRFGNPYRAFWTNGGSENLKNDYYFHSGIDFAPNRNSQNPNIYAIAKGEVVKIQVNDGKDHGLGNTIILKHALPNEIIYSLYSHLDTVKINLKEGGIVQSGETIGTVGNSGQGCRNYWRIGPEGCNQKSPSDTHLHLEIKKAGVLENPAGDKACKKPNGESRPCYGYMPDYPQKYGYLNPIEFLFAKKQKMNLN